MNFHTDEWINERVREHYEEALTMFPESQIVGVFYQGSANYGLDYEKSDIDTKCILTPSFKDICFNKKPISTTHILDNNEHLDAKDVRLYINCFEKQNLNFLEILFTPYKIVNPQYAEFWQKLVDAREDIAHYDIHRAVKSMKGIALEKYHAMEHRYPSKAEIIDKFGYDAKQLHHLLRVEYFLNEYIEGKPYAKCLRPTESQCDYLKRIKANNDLYSLEEARVIAAAAKERIEARCDEFCAETANVENKETLEMLREVQYEIIKISVENELKKEG